MQQCDIEVEVVRIINRQLDTSVHPDDNLEQEHDFDSLDRIELCMEIEEKFKIEISDEDWEVLKTPRQMVNYVEKRLNK